MFFYGQVTFSIDDWMAITTDNKHLPLIGRLLFMQVIILHL